MAQNVFTAITDLVQGVKMFRLGRLFAQNDKEAHRFNITVLENGAAADLSGYSASTYFMRPDDGVVTIPSTISGNVVSVSLPSACYEVPGHFSMIVKVHAGEATTASSITAVFWGDGTITRTETNIIIDPAHVVPNLDELLAQIATIEAATTAANTAASSANSAASSANTAASNASSMADLAETKAGLANAAASALNNMTVAASSASSASAAVSTVNNHYHIEFGLPKGDTGATGPQGPAGSLALSSSTQTLAAASWNSTYKSQTITVSGMSASSYVVVSPAPNSVPTYANAGVYCSSQGTNNLTFKCESIPSADLSVNVIIMS